MACAAAAHAGVLQGTVFESRSGRPLARARVTLDAAHGSSVDVSAAVLSDSSGQFTFTSLPAGAYLLAARKKGYAPVRFGQRQWNAAGTPIVLDQNGQFRAELRLKRFGVITGEVLDENGLGLSDIAVYAYHAGARLRLTRSGVTDDRGSYRLSGLEPGRYYVRTAPRELEDRRGLLPTFFGQTAKLEDARVVNVRIEEEVPGVDLEPLPGRLASLTGTLLGSGPATVRLYGDLVTRDARITPGGVFVFDGLAPGNYEVLAESGSGDAVLTAHQRVYVGGGQKVVQLELGPAPKVRIRCEGTSGEPLDTRPISIFLRRREDPSGANPQQAVCGGPVALAPGRWELAAAAPPELYVASIANAERGPEGYEFTLAARRDHQLVLTFGSNPAIVHGKVTTPDGQQAIGAPVFLYPLDGETRSRTGGIRTARAGQDGTFRIPGIPPGRYEVLSSFQVTDDPGTRWPLGRGTSLALEEGTEKALDLDLIDFEP